MAALVWDQRGQRRYENGVCRAVLYVKKNGIGHDCYEHGVAWNGIISITQSASGGEPNDIYADNIQYATLQSVEKLEGTVEAYTYPDEFETCDGSVQVTNGLYFNQQRRKRFALVYTTKIGSDVEMDESRAYKLHIIYNAVASPSERAYETENDSPDAMTMSWDITTIPIHTMAAGGTDLSSITIDALKLTDDEVLNLIGVLHILFGDENHEPTLLSPSEIRYYMVYGTDVELTPDMIDEYY